MKTDIYCDKIKEIRRLDDDQLRRKYNWHQERAIEHQEKLKKYRYLPYFAIVKNHNRIANKCRKVAKERDVEL